MRFTHLFAVVVALAVGCLMVGCGGGDGERSSDQPAHYKVSLPSGSTLDDAVLLLLPSEADEFKARIVYSGHESQVVVPTDLEGTRDVVQAERDRLKFLSEQFSPDNALESVVHDRFESDIVKLDESGTVTVSWVEYVGLPIADSELLAPPETAPKASDNGPATAQQAVVYDYPGDSWWTPAGGTSTIYTTGTLQKFWLDSASKSIINSSVSGLEMDTLIQGPSNASCETSGVGSNMPGYYADTEFLDISGFRNCSVGTINASQLQVGTLYWTWHPFGSFNTGANPHVIIQYQPKSWCSWVTSYAACSNNKPWCMCSMYLYSTESLVSYDYNDRPGQETSWIKN